MARKKRKVQKMKNKRDMTDVKKLIDEYLEKYEDIQDYITK